MTYLFAAYTVIWAALFAYLVYVDRKLARLAKELKSLK
jgi:CcmD family protein